MARPREQAGGLAEASRLLQEGLQLLAEREREVDQILADARERALLIRDEAERRAREITAEALARRAELEEQVAALHGEADALREELSARRANADAAAESRIAPVDVTPAAVNAAELGNSAHATTASAAADPDLPVALGTAEHEAPRWGRPAAAVGGQQAVRSGRGGKARWLGWLPFFLVLVAAAVVVVATHLNG